MYRGTKIVIVLIAVATVAITLFLIYYIGSMRSKGPKYKWIAEYYVTSPYHKEPYGLYYIVESLKHREDSGTLKIVEQAVKKELGKTTQGNYLFIGAALYLSHEDTDTLLNFVNEGNTAFIAAERFPEPLIIKLSDSLFNVNRLLLDTIEKKVSMYLYQPAMRTTFDYQYIDTPMMRRWHYFDTSFCNSLNSYTALGSIFQYPDFIEIPYGNGKVYLHSNPIVFTNRYIITNQGFSYADNVFSCLSNGELYFDGFSMIPHKDYYMGEGSPIVNFILEHDALKYATLLLLIAAVLFILFRSKRRQRKIPVIPPNTNTSLEYIKTVGRIYYKQKNHRKLAVLMRQLFYFYVWQNYHLSMKTIDKFLIQQISERAHLPEEDIDKIFYWTNYIEQQKNIASSELEMFYKALHHFYSQCK